jgi:nitrous oxidase accessory protein
MKTIIITLFLVFILMHGLMARVLIVEPGSSGHLKFRSIQSALSASLPGDTIVIKGGHIYKEKTITISKPVFIRGEGTPVLDGENKYEIIAIKSHDVRVEGLLLRFSGYSSYNDIAAIRIYNVRNVIIRNNILQNTFFGIYSQHGTSCLIENNTINSDAKDEISSANGIHCWKSDSMRIIGNTVSGHRDGIYFEFVTNSLIRGNTSKANVRYGLHFMFSHDNTYVSNVFLQNDAGVAVMYSHGVTMQNNLFSESKGAASYGILLKEITDSRIEANGFIDNTVGIFMEGSTRITMVNNNFSSNGWALKMQASCTENIISGNNFRNNTFDVATNGSLSLNLFSLNYWDKYEGYDLNRDGKGDIPYHPVSLYAMIAERNPPAMLLFRSFIVSLMDKTEKNLPGVTPPDLKDDSPLMKPVQL